MRIKQKPVMQFSWSDIVSMVDKLEEKIRASNLQFDIILGIAKGGCIPSALLADRFTKPLQVVTANHYAPTEIIPRSAVTIQNMVNPETWARYLIVDDVIESGDTMKAIYELLDQRGVNQSINAACLVRKTDQINYKRMSYFSATEIDHNVWVTFPWEITEYRRFTVDVTKVNTTE